MRVFDVQLINGMALTRSYVNTISDPIKFVGTLALGATDLADPNLSIELNLHYSLESGVWRQGPVVDWTGGVNAQQPVIHFDGIARRVRILIDPSRPVSVGADVSVS